MADEDTNMPLFPALHSVHINHCSVLNVVEFSNLLRQRCDKQGLQMLEIMCCRGFNESFVEEIHMLVLLLVWDHTTVWEDDSDDSYINVDGHKYYVEDFDSTDFLQSRGTQHH